jgi:hypothetical protein
VSTEAGAEDLPCPPSGGHRPNLEYQAAREEYAAIRAQLVVAGTVLTVLLPVQDHER